MPPVAFARSCRAATSPRVEVSPSRSNPATPLCNSAASWSRRTPGQHKLWGIALGCHSGRGAGSRSSFSSALRAVDGSVFAAASTVPYWDAACSLTTMVAAYGWVKFLDTLAANDVLERKISRKVVHITSGPLYVLTWPLFSGDPSARWYAVLPPLVQFLRLYVIGKGWVRNESAIRTISREGGAEELLRGPLYYVIVLGMVCGVFWRESPLGLVAIATMCAGDGMADIVGRNFGGAKLPFNQAKSWAGSAAMWFFGSCLSLGIVYLFQYLGYFTLERGLAPSLVLLSVLSATIVEALPVADRIDDNISVPLTAVAAGALVLMILPL
mmetsp:Transcript_41140/g.105180  ORF Transcript_41140/g.105180 Transcript_41140/m.105180 type:complete len:327 (+) Transcript_41140:138-1118(+)